ncbi:P-II family nitrogen regulator [Ammoniphilus sp. CFH 90114]|uniref:P-II family nitrogen regulator n=1 Tax=Ammoniphilus sp. CFH 90114 TaxID=2493665 RepID=UPI00100DCECD|nr:P-II family nitrogen regulator [Ammoniphilus sp. CFH 90114]RXT04354.1 P-II family nitrogen regulator [Ammoniphilus sp. CFH 90114]
MLKLEVIIRTEKIEQVKDQLSQIGIRGMTITEVQGCGAQKGQTGIYRGQTYEITLHPKMKLELVIYDHQLEEVSQSIQEHARTGEVGDGKIFIYRLEDAIRIRTGERGEEAI